MSSSLHGICIRNAGLCLCLHMWMYLCLCLCFLLLFMFVFVYVLVYVDVFAFAFVCVLVFVAVDASMDVYVCSLVMRGEYFDMHVSLCAENHHFPQRVPPFASKSVTWSSCHDFRASGKCLCECFSCL